MTTGDILKTIPQQQRRDYPDPQTLPVPPSSQQPSPLVTLSELIPGKYVSTTAKKTLLPNISYRKIHSSLQLYPLNWV